MSRAFAFRRGLQLALDACLSYSHEGELWLDAGCGRGQLAHALSSRGRPSVRLDLDLAMLWNNLDPASTPCVCADAQRSPWSSEQFQGVAAVSFLGCLDDPSEFFEEVARVLAPGGIFVVTHTNRSSLLLHFSNLFGSKNRPGQPISGSIRSHGPRAIRVALARAGFEILQQRTYHFVVDLGHWSVPASRLAHRLERLGNYGRSAWMGRNSLLVGRKGVR